MSVMLSVGSDIFYRTPPRVLDITDDGADITVTLRDSGSAWALMMRWEELRGRVELQDLRRLNAAWRHRRGVGRLLMNTGIQYLQQLEQAKTLRLHGFLKPHAGDPLPLQEHRVGFFERFGLQIHPLHFTFSTPIQELRVDVAEGLGLSGYPKFVSLDRFRVELK